MRRDEVSKDDLVGLIESIPDSATITVVEGTGRGLFDFGSFVIGWICCLVVLWTFMALLS